MKQMYQAFGQRLKTMPGKRPLILASSLLTMIGIAPVSSQGYSYEEQEACTGDAFRLCSEFIPNIPRITSCMEAKRDQLSPQCAKMFDTKRDRHLNDPHEHPSGEFREEHRDDKFEEHHDDKF